MPPQRPIKREDTPLINDNVFYAEDQEVIDLEEQIRNFNPMEFGRRIKSEDVKSEPEDEGTQDNAAFRAWNLEAQGEEDFRNAIGLAIDLTGEDDDDNVVHAPGPGPASPVRFTIEPDVQILTDGGVLAQHLDEEIKVGKFYELKEPLVNKYVKCTFIRITNFKKYPGAPWIAVGIPHARTRTLLGQLPRKTNEVFALYETADDNPKPVEEQALVEVAIDRILCQRFFHITNAPYPVHRFEANLFKTTKDVEKNGPIICRWNFIVHYHTYTTRVTQKPYEWALKRITAAEVEKKRFRVEEEVLRHEWRGETYRGGAHKPRGMAVDPTAPAPKERAIGQKYTFFDAFCGAGGASRGAERAGLEVKYGVDMWERAAASWRMNFARAEMFEMDIADFVNYTTTMKAADPNFKIRTDCLHLSPPCQVWSPAHTIAGQHDERNIMALFACRTLVEEIRPRIVTLEQTFGILNPIFKKYFDALVLGFTEQGYSIGWKIINCATYGLPQRRTRLVMIASCPGEELPDFPAPTHSSTGENGLRKYTSIAQAISKVTGEFARNDPHHNPKYKQAPREAVIGDPNQILPRCMTTSGGQNYHYSGLRCYTNREFACLQGFPIWHKFSESYVKKQIGNAFPPIVVQTLYEHIQKHLHKQDGFEGDSRPRVTTGVDHIEIDDDHNMQGPGRSAGDAIEIDDNDNDDDVLIIERGGAGWLANRMPRSNGRSVGSAIQIVEDDDDDVQMIDRPVSVASSRTLSGDESLFVKD
ncbi:C-5 cytosine-specific DNA methylase [Plectosphaerella plurivora]|uniref:DNA (cytosine-5-)-methyltransferase n=1 Tax=Plectosphaerella plurivora TaxID=936078 RepID=A0A9P8V0U7_9PEZI|nr:C-5 cytosine-specific DNA methylase [Plectosphaerella plurivora]